MSNLKERPKVSVIVAAYNIENYINRCIESLVNQTLYDIEIIVVNDGSTDNTLNNIEQYSKQDHRIKVINKSNEGLVAARKSGFEIANGEYVLFVDGDDWLKLECCDLLYNKAKKDCADIVYYNLIVAKNKKYKNVNSCIFGIATEYKFLDLILTNKIKANIFLQLINRNFILNNNIKFPEGITYGEDLALSIELALKKPKVTYLDKNLYYYFQRSTSITNQVNNKVFEVEKVIDDVREKLENNNIMNEYQEQYNFLAFIHLYYYRIINVKYITSLHKELFERWNRKNILIDKKNLYYDEFYKSLSLDKKITIKLYNYNYLLGKSYTNFKYRITFIPKYIIKKIIY